MVGEGVEKKIYDAAAIGDVTAFQELLQTNQHLLDVVSFSCLKNVLHIAIKHGQESIVEEVLNINTELALDLDSKNSSSLHIAAAKGNVEIAKRLVSIAPEMCWWRDCHDMNPIHIAAMKGRVEVLKELIQLDISAATERVQRGQTVFHLCVKHRQIETLKVLVESELGDMVCANDDDGETLLHLAVRSNQAEIVRYLVESNKIEKLAKNSMGKTAMDILNESFQDTSTYSEIAGTLEFLTDQSFVEKLPKYNDLTMVVAVLIAAVAFQAAVSPPGGVWQDDTSSHSVGKAVMATTHPKIYKHFIRANTTAFISSLFTILIITIAGQLEHYSIVLYPFYSIWVSLVSTGVSYGASLMMTNPMETLSIGHFAGIAVSVLIFVNVLLAVHSLIHELYSDSWKIKLLRELREEEDLTTT